MPYLRTQEDSIKPAYFDDTTQTGVNKVFESSSDSGYHLCYYHIQRVERTIQTSPKWKTVEGIERSKGGIDDTGVKGP